MAPFIREKEGGVKTRILASICFAALAGCATVPQGNFARVTPNDAIAPSAVGENVHWAGRVAGPRDLGGAACIEVSTYDISRQTGAPVYDTIGRAPSPFLACGGPSASDHSYDGSLVTLTGV